MLPFQSSRPPDATMLHVAGIGASAGGIEAMLPMFRHMRPTGRIAYVVAQHMAKDGHDTLVVRLIQRESALPVVLAGQATRLQTDTVYVIPSGKDGRVQDNVLDLSEPSPEHLSTPSVNALFTSIAACCHDRAIGIVLSGTGSDGTAGCRAIKAIGGLTLAQEPAEAKFDGMPTAAIESRVVDHVLPVDGIGETLATLFPGKPRPDWRPPDNAPTSLACELAARVPDYADPMVVDPGYRELAQLLRQVLEATGIDFSSYKEETLLRRLEKRKSILGIDSADAYQTHIRKNTDELKILQHLFLVSVSSFFRDRDSFQILKISLAQLVAGKPRQEPIRVWVPGCASGEEPYTLAILLRDLTDRHLIEIIATDLNPEALAMAREGLYRQTAFKEMDAPLIERHFTPKGQHYQINPDMQACVRFEQRDVLTGPPPALFDLISCRNLLIYMKSRLQDTLIKHFHQGLRPHGLLFIGPSESLSFLGNSLFAPVDHYHRLFRRRS